MILFRLQNVNSQSPYELDLNKFSLTFGKVFRNMYESHNFNRPLFYNSLSNTELESFHNFRDNKNVQYHYFTSLQFLNDWYGHWQEFMLKSGFSVVKLNIDDHRVFINADGHACVSAQAC